MEEIISVLKELREEVLIFPSNDLLVNLSNQKVCDLNINPENFDQQISKMIRESKTMEKQTGLNPMCVAQGSIRLFVQSTEINSPVFLTPVEMTISPSKEKFKLVRITDHPIINPFIIHHFNIQSDKEDMIIDFESLEKLLDLETNQIKKNDLFLGNFHPKRFSFLREIEGVIDQNLKSSNALKDIFGNESNNNHLQLESEYPLFRNDDDQCLVYEKIKNGSVVVQGPPGTGKSQVIGNIIASTIASHQSALLISEKKVALDVIQNKLKKKGLDPLCFQIPSRHANRQFIFELKKSWDFFNEMNPGPKKSFLRKFQQQNKIYNILENHSKVQGCTIYELIKIINEHKNLAITQSGNTITMGEYKSAETIFSKIPNELMLVLKFFKPKLTAGDFLQFDEDLNQVLSVLKKVKDTQNVKNWEQLNKTLQSLLRYHNFNTKTYQQYGHFLSSKNKAFTTLKKQLNHYETQIKILQENESHWLQKPNNEELKFLKEILLNKKSIIQDIKWRWTWRKWTRSPKANAEKMIDNRIQLLKKTEKRDWVLKKFYDLGISDTDTEVELVTTLIENTDIAHWEQYQIEKNTSYDSISHKDLYRSIDILKHCFDFKGEDQPLEILNLLSQKKDLLLGCWADIKQLPDKIYPYLDTNTRIIKENIQKNVARNLLCMNPELKQFSTSNFLSECISVQKNFDKESRTYADQLIINRFDQFQYLENLTKTSPQKLNEEDKTLRKKLKKGKSILIKEFGKKKSHQTIRKLFNSEAYLWIQTLKPIWLSNPNNLSESIPLKEEIFDYLIADESSQLLLSHSIGGLQRAKKAVICGDPQQMSPGSYFQKKQILEIDLLHHANYYLNHVFLSNHYRSEHPDLIDFSNRFFYNNKLKAFRDHSCVKHPIQHHFVENGFYFERTNLVEAQQICKFISTHIESNEKIGIVAFSKAQLSCIYNHLDAKTRSKLDQRIEKDSLFFQSLEKVQGDECDRLIISFGYGYNNDHKFELRFGPVNMHGGHKRLNVLFSRAKRKIDFFSSIKLKDFPSSKNQGVIYLKKWFELLEKDNINTLPQSNISLASILDNCNGFNDLISYLHVYQSRGYLVSL